MYFINCASRKPFGQCCSVTMATQYWWISTIIVNQSSMLLYVRLALGVGSVPTCIHLLPVPQPSVDILSISKSCCCTYYTAGIDVL